MFVKFAIFVASVAVFAAALPATELHVPAGVLPRGGHDSGIEKSCNTGPVQCCNSVHSAQDQAIQTLAGILPIGIQDVTAQIGLVCNPISALAIAGNSCSSQPVCCSENNYNGLVAVGCTPINANL